MRTVNKVGGANGTIFTEFYGNTTDVKPTEDVPNGSAFYEVDNNMQEYRFDKENKIWYSITRGGTAPSDDYLPLSGGIMTGDINMNGNSLLNAKSIYVNDNTDINKVKYISGLLPTNIFIDNYNTVGYNLVGTNISENTFTFYSNDKNNKHSQIQIIYNVEDNLPRLSFKAGYNDRINLPVLLKGADTPVDDTDAANKAYVDQETAKYLPLTGGTMSDNINMSGSSIYSIDNLTLTNGVLLKDYTVNNRKYLDIKDRATMIKVSVKAGNAVEDDELVTKSQMETADSKYLPLTGTTEDNPVTGVVTFNGESTITGVSTPVNDTDVVTKKYADDVKTELDDKTNQLKEDLDDLSKSTKTGIYPVSGITWESGTINTDGTTAANRKMITTSDILVSQTGLNIELSDLALSNGYSYTVHLKNIDGSYKKGGTWYTEKQTLYPERSGYVRITLFLNTQVGTMPISANSNIKITEKQLETVAELKEQTKENIFFLDFYKYIFTKCICIGDSLTRGFYNKEYPNGNGEYPTYPQQLAKITGWTVTNAGKSEADAIEWYTNRLNLYTYDDKDIAIIFLGTNHGLTDTVSDGANTSTNTGCYMSIIEYLHSKNEDMKIFVCTVSSVSGTDSDVATTNKAIKDISDKYDYVYLLDINDNNYYDLNNDICHPSYIGTVHRGSNGYTLQAMVIANLINDAVRNNITSFEVVLREGKGQS